ncbi:MAG: glycosyltransferase [Verrucomicrobiota bacterium]|jgi:glycosyltransferase involved in cell wall biosynthesis
MEKGTTHRALHVGVVTHEPFWPATGGGSSQAPFLVRALRARGHRVSLICPCADAEERASIESRFGVDLVPFDRYRMGRRARLRSVKYLGYPFFVKRLLAGVQAHDPMDVVLAQHSISGVGAGWFGRRSGVPVVLNYLDFLSGYLQHGLLARRPFRLFPKLLQAFEAGMPTRFNAAAVLTISDTLAEYLAARGYSASRIHPIYYGFDAERFDPDQVDPPAGMEPGYVMTHGSLDDFHVSGLLLDAMSYVVARRPETRFVIVGQGRARYMRFRRRCEARLGSRVTFTGWVPYEEIPSYLKGAAVGMVPYPPSPGAHHTVVCKLIEYAAMGVPSVCTELEGTRRYFSGDPGIVFAPFEGAALGQEILKLLETPFSLERPANLRVRAAQNWGALAARVAEIVESAAAVAPHFDFDNDRTDRTDRTDRQPLPGGDA